MNELPSFRRFVLCAAVAACLLDGQRILLGGDPLVFSVTAHGAGAVGPLTNGQSLVLGKGYTLTARPRPGNLFSHWSGTLLSYSPTLNFTALSNVTLIAHFATNLFPQLKGHYTGLLADAVNPAHENAGWFTFNLSGGGTFSGRLTLAGKNVPLSGRYDAAQHAHRTIIRSAPTAPIEIDLQLGPTLDEVNGTVSAGFVTSELAGYRVPTPSVAAVALFAGRYTMLFSGSEDPAARSFGQGYATLNVRTNGRVTLVGTLADNKPIAQSRLLHRRLARGQILFYETLYGGGGSCFGWLTLQEAPESDIHGRLLWTKSAGIAGRLYPVGFVQETRLFGSRYTATNRPLLNFSKAAVLLEGGNLMSRTTNEVLQSAQNKIVVTPPDTSKLALGISQRSGMFTGRFLNSGTGKLSPMPASAQSGVTAIAAGAYFTVALKNDGSVVAWGANSAGQTSVPVAAQSGVTAIAPGNLHTVALKTNGSVVAWGDNFYGQTTVPVAAQSGVRAIAAGSHHTVVLKHDGTVVAWGYNFSGQVTGTPGTNDPNSAIANPVTLGGNVLSAVAAIAAGAQHTVALKNDGSVVVWGWSGASQVPVAAQSGVAAIAAGYNYTVALKNDGSVVEWSDSGQWPVPEGLSRVTAIAAGQGHTVVLVIPTVPTITTQPVSQTVNVGQGASFTVSATGFPVSYQWRKDGVDLAGATSATYILPFALTNHAGSYTVVVSNPAGSVTNSPSAVLTVNPPSGTVVAWRGKDDYYYGDSGGHYHTVALVGTAVSVQRNP